MLPQKGDDFMANKFIFKNYIPVKTKEKGEWLSDKAMLVYAIINMHTNGHWGVPYYYITVDDVVRELYGPDGLDSNRRKNVKTGFVNLQLCFPQIFEATDLSYKVWRINVDEMFTFDPNYYYCYCYNQDLMKLIKNEKHHMFAICGFYFKYLSTFDFNFNIHRISMSYVGNILGINESTVEKHLKTLTKKENTVLKTYKCTSKKTKKGTYYQHPDIHYRPIEENLVYEYLDLQQQSFFIPNNPSPND